MALTNLEIKALQTKVAEALISDLKPEHDSVSLTQEQVNQVLNISEMHESIQLQPRHQKLQLSRLLVKYYRAVNSLYDKTEKQTAIKAPKLDESTSYTNDSEENKEQDKLQLSRLLVKYYRAVNSLYDKTEKQTAIKAPKLDESTSYTNDSEENKEQDVPKNEFECKI
ncbi:hypothetical protein FB446DRAFT_709423 [Lentinula raphanica]|nr:hypothetical protein FB446DRAFT_709423 [Lentinula raphanica]